MSSTNAPTGRSSRPASENLTTGTVYYAFDRAGNVQPTAYNPSLPLFWSLDFNINPMCSILGQRVGEKVHILDEMILPDSNSLAACEEFLSRTAEWVRISNLPINLSIYGGWHRAICAGHRRHAPTGRSFGNFSAGIGTASTIPSRFAHPTRRSKIRVNAVSTRCCATQAGRRRLLIDPGCKQLIKDSLKVCALEERPQRKYCWSDIDKSDPMRSHAASDALGYMIAREFPMRAYVGERPGVLQ